MAESERERIKRELRERVVRDPAAFLRWCAIAPPVPFPNQAALIEALGEALAARDADRQAADALAKVLEG